MRTAALVSARDRCKYCMQNCQIRATTSASFLTCSFSAYVGALHQPSVGCKFCSKDDRRCSWLIPKHQNRMTMRSFLWRDKLILNRHLPAFSPTSVVSNKPRIDSSHPGICKYGTHHIQTDCNLLFILQIKRMALQSDQLSCVCNITKVQLLHYRHGFWAQM